VSGKDRASDLREGKKTIISIQAMEKGLDLSSYRRDLSFSEIDQVIGQLEELGVLDYARDMARELITNGKQRISILPDSGEKDLLLELADHFLARSF
jgi:geranylgeranyl diphosphate synthase type I